MKFKATIYSLYLHDGFCWITEVACMITLYANSEAEAMIKLKRMTDLPFDLEVE